MTHAGHVDPSLVEKADVVLSCYYTGDKTPFRKNHKYSVHISYKGDLLTASCNQEEEEGGEDIIILHSRVRPSNEDFRNFHRLALSRAATLIKEGHTLERSWFLLNQDLPERFHCYREYLLSIVCEAWEPDYWQETFDYCIEGL
jgi:hypothetical protein